MPSLLTSGTALPSTCGRSLNFNAPNFQYRYRKSDEMKFCVQKSVSTACGMLLALLLGSILCGALCVPVGNHELADSLKWSKDSVQADLRAVVEQRLERFFKIDDYSKCVVSKETELLNYASKGLSDAVKQIQGNEDVTTSLMGLLEVLDGNGRMVVESSESIPGLLGFKSRFRDILSMSLSSPGDKNFAKRVEEVQRKVPETSPILDTVKDIPTNMLENFDSFASVDNCAANIRK